MPYKDLAAQRAYQNRWMQQRREEWLASNGPCVACGNDQNLEVDHINPALKVNHRVWSWSEERRLVELAKCQVLCSDCHTTKTNAAKAERLRHGETETLYERGCRCEPCRAVRSRMKQERRRKRKAAGLPVT